MIKNSLCTFLGLLACGLSLQAQTAAPPQAPYLPPDSGTLQWTVHVQGLPEKQKNPSQESSPADPGIAGASPNSSPRPGRRLLRQIDATRSNNLLRKVNTWSNGTTTVKWWQGPYLLLKEPKDDDILVASWASFCFTQETYAEYASANFTELNWVGPTTFLEWTTLGDRQVAVYGQTQSQADAFRIDSKSEMLKAMKNMDTLKPRPQDSETGPPTSREGFARLAWIDARTKRPIAMEAGRLRFTYHFSDGVIAPLTLPPEFQQAMDRHQIATTAPTMKVKP